MKPAAVVVLLLVLLSALAPSPASASVSVVAEVHVDGEKLVAPLAVPFGTQPLGNISTGIFTLCFQQMSSPSGSCDRGGTVSLVDQVAAPFYAAGVFRENVMTGAKSLVSFPVSLAAGQRLVVYEQWVADRLGSVADTQHLRAQASGASAEDVFLDFTASGQTPGPCVPGSEVVCLNNNRFKVKAHFLTSGATSGLAATEELTSDTGFLTFFNPANVESVIKVLDACGVNNRYWVFAGGLTDVRTVITVTDTQKNAVKTYVNPQGTAFQPIQDTSAFATCP